MLISLIAALDQRDGIGRQNKMPWHLSDDLKHFRRLTMGQHVLMGRKTYQSAAGKMPGRYLIVLSRDPAFQPADAQVAASLQAGLQLAADASAEELFVIGGEEVFRQALPLAKRFYLTRVHTDAGADVFFPPFAMHEWHITEQSEFPAGPKNDHAFTVYLLEK